MLESRDPLTADAFQAQFLRFRGELTAYLFRLTTNRQDAEDLAQETYLKASKRLAGFSGKSTLKTWVFSIATNLARDHFRVQRRWQTDIQERCRAVIEGSPERLAEMRDLLDPVGYAGDLEPHPKVVANKIRKFVSESVDA